MTRPGTERTQLPEEWDPADYEDRPEGPGRAQQSGRTGRGSRGKRGSGAKQPQRARPRGRGKAPQEPQEVTPLLAIRQQRRRAAQIEEIVVFAERLVGLAAVLAVLFGVIFGITPMGDDDMSPRISAGDLLLYYRLDRNPVSGDVIVFVKDGEEYVARVVARGGETVEVTEEATLKVNGSTVLESDIYYSTPQYDSDVVYPVTLAEDEVFVLCDYREGAADSRMFGAVSVAEIRGTVITVIRRSDL